MAISAATPLEASTWPDVLTSLLQGRDLSLPVAAWAMDQIMSGEASESQIAGFLIALRAKGETPDELRGLADVMLAHAHRFTVPDPAIDIVGTGGDRSHTVNISTMSAIVAAASGVRVVKHGNRAASSSSGSADVLESLGVDLTLTPAEVAAVAERAGITFCFALAFHPSMRHASTTRRDLGIGTAFNVLGPITNPAQPTFAAVGVADLRLAPVIAGVFAGRGRAAIVFRGEDGLDELSIAAPSRIWWVSGAITEHVVAPEDLGLVRSPLEALRGGDPAFNADVARALFAGRTGPVRDAVVLNAGAALALAHSSGELTGDQVRTEDLITAIRAGMDLAERSLDSGAAAATLDRWVEATHGR